MAISQSGTTAVDTHAHVWRLAEGDYSWLSAPQWAPIQRDFTVHDLEAELASAGIGGVVLVHALQSDAENEELLSAADSSEAVLGVVGWTPLANAQRLRTRLEELTQRPAFRGVRHMVGWSLESDLLASGGVVAASRVLADFGLVAEVMPAAISDVDDVVELARCAPDLQIVIDHLAKPGLDGHDFDRWAAVMTTAAREPNIATKVSGWTTPPGPHASGTKLRPLVEHVVETFGVDRLMYASNWPVTLVAGSYRWMWEETQSALSGLSSAERAAVLGGTARRLYRLGPGR